MLEVKERIKTHLSLMLARRELANQNIILEEKVKERIKELAITNDLPPLFVPPLKLEFRSIQTVVM
jgi:hypothetical protein